ncbi:hypothetical protein RJT34_02924 [Clitoria ternatea]|uniref:DUF4378 domain-containing protein n=1 Tax=Clitoria ternatea TaxID=43366 RepID=A0AAN9KIH4_CLITE
MARRSPPLVNQTCETGCTWRMFRIFSFREAHSDRRTPVPSRRHVNAQATAAGFGNSRSSLDVLSTVDEKYQHIRACSRRKYSSCKNTSCVENDHAADWGNEATKMIVDQRFINKYYQGKDGTGCQPNQFMDALQILYSNKELFIKLLQDPNSLLVKQIHELPSSHVKEPYQGRQKRMTKMNKSQKSNTTQCVKPLRSFDRYDSITSCEHRSPNRIVVLKPGTVDVKKIADTSFGCPWPHSPSSFSSNTQNIKPLHFPLGRIKTKLRHVMRVKRKGQQWRTDDGVPYKFPCGSQGMKDGKNVKEMEIAAKNLPINVHTNAASFGESGSRDTYNTSMSPSEQNILNMHVKGRKGPSQILNCGVEECKQCSSSLGRTIPLPDILSLPSLGRYCEESSSTEEMNHYNSPHKDPPVAIVSAQRDKLQLFGEDTSIRNSLSGDNIHTHYDISKDGRYKDSPIQKININNTTEGSVSFLDSHPAIQTLSPSPSPSFCHTIEDTGNWSKGAQDHSTVSVVLEFNRDDVTLVTNPSTTIFQPDKSPAQVMHDEFEENHFADLIRFCSDPINNLTFSKDILDNVIKILQVFSLKWDELTMKRSFDQLLNPSTFDELKELTGQLSSGSGTNLLDCVMETFMEVYQNCGFPPPHISTNNLNLKAYVAKKRMVEKITELVNMHFHTHPSLLTLDELVEKDFARSGSWLSIQVDAQDIAIEVEKHVIENLVLEIACEMDIWKP